MRKQLLQALREADTLDELYLILNYVRRNKVGGSIKRY